MKFKSSKKINGKDFVFRLPNELEAYPHLTAQMTKNASELGPASVRLCLDCRIDEDGAATEAECKAYFAQRVLVPVGIAAEISEASAGEEALRILK